MGARVVASFVVLFLGISLTGCSPEKTALDPEAGWRTSSHPVDLTGLVWADGSTVHLADGSTIDTGKLIRAFVVAGDGVFFVPATSSENVGTMTFTDEELFFASPQDTGTSTGLSVSGTGMMAAPDGQHLAVLDADYDSGEAVMRVFDLTAGEEFTSEEGMDTSGIEDPVDHLLEMEVGIQGMTDTAVSARVLQGDYAYELSTGHGRPVGADEVAPGVVVDAHESPDGSWRIEQVDSLRDTLVSAKGVKIVPASGTDRWTLSRWVDTETALGVAIDGPGRGLDIDERDTLTLMTCQVPDGACTLVSGTAGATVVFPLGTIPTTLADLGS